MTRLTRRTLLLMASGLLAAGPRPAHAQRRLPLVGFVSWFSPAEAADLARLREGLAEHGLVDGAGVTLEAHWTDGSRERTREVLLSLVQRQADVLVVRATAAAHIAKEVAGRVPVVMLVADPLATGLVDSLARPGGTMTGLSLLGPDLAGKRLAFLQAIKPSVKRVGFLGSSADQNAGTFAGQTRAAGTALGIAVVERLVAGPAGLAPAVFDGFAREGAEAVIVQPIFAGHQDRIVALARTAGLPVISNYRAFAEAGALFTYGPDDAALTRRAGYFVDRILKGARPGDLPIEQPSQFQLVINLKAARELGLTVPNTLTATADDLID